MKKQDVGLPIIMPNMVLLPREIEAVVTHSLNILLEKYSGLEGYVILYQMERVISLAKERLKEKAINGMSGKECDVLGATVTTRRSAKYEYDAPTLQRMENKKKEIDEQLKGIKKALEATGTYIDPETGETNTANKISDGVVLAVSLPKE